MASPARRGPTSKAGEPAARPSLLAGLIHDDAGGRMTPSHANKKGTRYRYCVSQALVSGNRRSAPRARRVPAGDLEALAEDRLRRFLGDRAEIIGAIETQLQDVNHCADVITRAADLARRRPRLAPAEKRAVVSALVDRVDLPRETIEIRIMPGRPQSTTWGTTETGVRDIGPHSRPRAALRRSRHTTTRCRQRPRSRKLRAKFESMLES